MSGYTQGLLSQQRVLDPGVHLIEKPFTETILLAKVREILSAHTGLPPATRPCPPPPHRRCGDTRTRPPLARADGEREVSCQTGLVTAS